MNTIAHAHTSTLLIPTYLPQAIKRIMRSVYRDLSEAEIPIHRLSKCGTRNKLSRISVFIHVSNTKRECENPRFLPTNGRSGKAMNLRKLDRMLEEGQTIFVRYEYPSTERSMENGSIYRVRTDRLLDVELETNRLFVQFDGRVPIWIEKYEAIDVWAEDEVPAEAAA